MRMCHKSYEWRSLNNYKILPLELPQNVHHDPFLAGLKLTSTFVHVEIFEFLFSLLLWLNCYVWKNIDWQHLKFSFHYFCMWKKSVSAQSTSIISHTFDEILEIYKKYFQVAIQNLIIILFHLLYSHSFTRHINKYSVKTKERNVIFERKYLTNWIFLFFFFTLKIYKNIKNVNVEWIYLHTNKRRRRRRRG